MKINKKFWKSTDSPKKTELALNELKKISREDKGVLKEYCRDSSGEDKIMREKDLQEKLSERDCNNKENKRKSKKRNKDKY